jgi:hypothetical protein
MTTEGPSMSRERPKTQTGAGQRRARNGTQADGPSRRRPRDLTTEQLELSEEELRALADDRVDPDEVLQLAHSDDEQEASEHDRDTARDRLEGLLAEQADDY